MPSKWTYKLEATALEYYRVEGRKVEDAIQTGADKGLWKPMLRQSFLFHVKKAIRREVLKEAPDTTPEELEEFVQGELRVGFKDRHSNYKLKYLLKNWGNKEIPVKEMVKHLKFSSYTALKCHMAYLRNKGYVFPPRPPGNAKGAKLGPRKPRK